ncbi:MAG: hypothetical protein HYU64_11860 [Armatimonadetes bacterium]|nr:hypothetical protein [Armatimonadota bacterium]
MRKLILAGLLVLGLLCPVLAQEEITLVVKRVSGKIPLDLNGSVWKGIKPTLVELQMQDQAAPFGGGSIKDVIVRAIHNGKEIAFLMEWKDKTRDETMEGMASFRDGVALQFPLKTDDPGTPLMGGDGLVNIWYWRADWQAILDGRYKEVQPVLDYYPEKSLPGGTGLIPAVLAENPIARGPKGSPVEDLNARSYGTLTSQDRQDVSGKGAWKKGTWRVLFLRPLKTKDPMDAQFVPGKQTFINFAAWNGGDKDKNGHKSVTFLWHFLKLEK